MLPSLLKEAWNFLGHHCRGPHPDCGLYGPHWHLAVFPVMPLFCRLTCANIPLDWSNGIGPCWSPGTQRIKLKIVKRTWNTCEWKKRDDEFSFPSRCWQWGQRQDRQIPRSGEKWKMHVIDTMALAIRQLCQRAPRRGQDSHWKDWGKWIMAILSFPFRPGGSTLPLPFGPQSQWVIEVGWIWRSSGPVELIRMPNLVNNVEFRNTS